MPSGDHAGAAKVADEMAEIDSSSHFAQQALMGAARVYSLAAAAAARGGLGRVAGTADLIAGAAAGRHDQGEEGDRQGSGGLHRWAP